MIDSHIKIPDNVGTSFEIVNGNIILGAPQSTFVGLSSSYVDSYIPYFIKNLLPNGITEWEIGIGKVISTTIIERTLVSSSSNNNDFVIFSFGGTKTFFIYSNEHLSNIAYNNLINTSGTFNIPQIRSTYVVDLSSSNASGLLPSVSGSRGVVLDFKAQNRNNYNLILKPTGTDLIEGGASLLIDYDDAYTSIVSDGEQWVQLKDNVQINIDPNLLGSPQGSNGSIQYKSSSSSFAGSNIFFDPTSGSLLFGSSSQSSANNIVAQSGNTIFNQNSKNLDFIVNGSGNKNMVFSSQGRLGLNLPSGVQPQTLIHAVGTSCDTSLRIENRGSCTTPKIVLYHKPSTSISDNSEISSIVLSAKNSSGAETEYGKIKAVASVTNSVAPTGSMVLSVNNGGLILDSIVISPTGAILQTKDDRLLVSSSGVSANRFIASSGLFAPYISPTGSLLSVSQSGMVVNSGFSVTDLEQIANKASLSGAIFFGDITVPRIYGTSHTTQNPQLIDVSGLNLSGAWKLNNANILSASTSDPAESGYILTNNGAGVEWREFNEYNFLWSGNDISWKKYANRACIVQNNRDVIAIPTDTIDAEFSVSDTVKIDVSGNIYYRTVTQLSESDGYTNITINDPVLISGSGSIRSVSKGGYLDLSVDSVGAPNVSPQTIISSRPNFSTVFNNKKHNIDFSVYGTTTNPALYVRASGVNSYDSTASVAINGSGIKTVTQINNLNKYASLTVNGYLYTDYLQIGSTVVPSGYILTSTSGNIAEWKSTTTISELDGGVVVFTGVSL